MYGTMSQLARYIMHHVHVGSIHITCPSLLNRVPADRKASIKVSGFNRPGLGVKVLCLDTAT